MDPSSKRKLSQRQQHSRLPGKKIFLLAYVTQPLLHPNVQANFPVFARKILQFTRSNAGISTWFVYTSPLVRAEQKRLIFYIWGGVEWGALLTIIIILGDYHFHCKVVTLTRVPFPLSLPHSSGAYGLRIPFKSLSSSRHF